jgi:hypothetical protein
MRTQLFDVLDPATSILSVLASVGAGIDNTPASPRTFRLPR